MTSSSTPHQKGFVLLAAVAILAMVTLAIALSLVDWGTNASKLTTILDQTARSRSLANACAEHALHQLKLDATYAGDETIPLDPDSCAILPITQTDNTYTIKTKGASGQALSRLVITTTRLELNETTTAHIEVQSWHTVSDH